MRVVRRTLSRVVRIVGRGLHTGVPVTIDVHPSQDGICFRYGAERVAAKAANVSDTTRCTKIGSIGTVEHMMSALAGLEITDAEIETNAPEMPGLDGSSQAYVTAFLEAGLEELGSMDRPDLYQRAFLQEGPIKISASKGTGQWRYVYDTGQRWPQIQEFGSDDVVGDYKTCIAPARTFALSEEVPVIIQQGLGRGLDEDTALILGLEGYKNEPRFQDEPARHKLLDMLGDLYLSGVPARMLNVVGERSGHRTNVMAAAMIAESLGA